MSKAKLKKHLSALSKEQVVDIMLQLYDASKEANSWLEFYLEPNSDAELEKYKKAIRSQFYGSLGYVPCLPLGLPIDEIAGNHMVLRAVRGSGHTAAV